MSFIDASIKEPAGNGRQLLYNEFLGKFNLISLERFLSVLERKVNRICDNVDDSTSMLVYEMDVLAKYQEKRSLFFIKGGSVRVEGYNPANSLRGYFGRMKKYALIDAAKTLGNDRIECDVYLDIMSFDDCISHEIKAKNPEK